MGIETAIWAESPYHFEGDLNVAGDQVSSQIFVYIGRNPVCKGDIVLVSRLGDGGDVYVRILPDEIQDGWEESVSLKVGETHNSEVYPPLIFIGTAD